MSELIDSQGERFIAAGEAPDVVTADEDAWRSLKSKLGRDPLDAWSLVDMVHTFQGEDEQIAWRAIFARDPDVEIPPPTRVRDFEEIGDKEIERFKRGGA